MDFDITSFITAETLVSWKGAEMLRGVGSKQPEVKP